ncbi:MAG: carboxypeptidase regulatory-like domain-containing protein [Acidobacteria bacterium]|nr:carboxypeptidase regulatory-like domain-containing protein [Acidobacteriota bacterium]MBI3282095.1 carboxypeptidase regulatory-like domain-containing protein [Acidobacteriota bacterium]
MKKRVAFALTLLLGAATLCLGADKKREDTSTRSVQGIVSDATDKPVDGAVVKLKDTKTLQVRSFITQTDGAYHFHGLNPDIDYELKAEHGGQASNDRTLSAFDSRRNAVINLKLEAKK